MTWLGFLNRYIFQWFFIRLTKHRKTIVKETMDFSYIDQSLENDFGFIDKDECITNLEYIQEWFSFQFFVKPLSGWGGKFKYLSDKPYFIRITKKRGSIKTK